MRNLRYSKDRPAKRLDDDLWAVMETNSVLFPIAWTPIDILEAAVRVPIMTALREQIRK